MWDPKAYVEVCLKIPKPELTYAPGKFYQTDVFTDYALEFLKQARAEKGKPWFMYLAYGAAFPAQAPEGMMEAISPHISPWLGCAEGERLKRMKKIGLADDTWRFTPRSQVPRGCGRGGEWIWRRAEPAWDSLPEDRHEDLAHRMALYAAMLSTAWIQTSGGFSMI